jgi:hypothetical protein
VVVLPALGDDGGLPEGIHVASWDEIVGLFGKTDHRRDLLAGLADLLVNLRDAGCRLAYLDGSFVTDKEVPNDYDLCWEMDAVDLTKLDSIVLDVAPPRAAQHARYRGDILPNVVEANSGAPFVDFFQQNKITGGIKGIVAIRVEEVE